MTYECASRLTENATDIHDTLKTYILKTCLFVLHLRDPSLKQRGNELLPEQWALLIYKQLLQFIHKGKLAILFERTTRDGDSALFHCTHDLDEMLKHDELRAACCDQRINLLIIAEHIHNILSRYCQMKEVSVDQIFLNLPPYDHDA